MFCLRLMVYLVLFAGLFGCANTGLKEQKRLQQADVHYKLGASHLQANNPTSALKEFLIAVDNDPENAAIQVALAQAYQLKKAYPEAERHYLRALALSDNDPRYQNNLASLYLDMGEWDKAIDYFDKASSDLLFLRPYIALAGKGYAYLKKQDYQAALQHLDEALAVAPRYAQAYYLQSEVYLAMGQNENARIALENAIETAPGYLQAIYELGVLMYKENQNADAVEKFEQVVELSPGSNWGRKSAQMLREIIKAENVAD